MTENRNYQLKEIKEMLLLQGEDASSLHREANSLTENLFGKSVFVRGIIEFSNVCAKNCAYCGIRRDNRKVKRYHMDKDYIKQIIFEAYRDGFRTIVLQSGEVDTYDHDITEVIEYVKSKCDIAITLSMGEKSREQYVEWKKAGADRYLLRIETTNKKLFKTLHPDDDYENRLKSLLTLKELGFEAGTGVMIGLPGQTAEDMANDILFFKEHDFDMLGVGPFIPHNDTPLKGHTSTAFEKVLNFVSAMRLVTYDTNIPATTSMATLERDGREMALNAGANVIMPNYTPQIYRESYKLYENKICTDEDAERTMELTRATVENAGKVLVMERGDRRARRDEQKQCAGTSVNRPGDSN
ncbi:MAG: [FeFe] hydrogenase H-cluster radical SAM maturase HydE [bacterium]|nr:[FeFe] hydrogenase H-cluster radical SAM maturase HydE [bacterium]